MRYIILYIILAVIISFVRCGRQQTHSVKSFEEIENLIDNQSDMALSKLDSISSQKMSDKDYAYRCMLFGRLADKQHTPLLPAEQFERASKWYHLHGTIEEQVQMQLYLGRAYAEDGDYNKAMLIYTNNLEIAHNNNLFDFVGYINSYMGVLYEERGMRTQAISKFEAAAEYFNEAKNIDSYICALRDVGREYARIDSFLQARSILFMADSIATYTNTKAVKSSLINTIGGIYLMQQEYDKAKDCYYRALSLGTNNLPNYVGLIKAYIETDSLDKAKEILQNMPLNNPKYNYSIKWYYFLIYRQEKRYEDALNSLEDYTYLLDSIVKAENQSKILNIEKKYNDLRNQKKIKDLIISRQKYIIILFICILIILFMTVIYMIYRRRTRIEVQKQQMKLNEVSTKLLHLSLDLEKKKAKLLTFEEKNENYSQMKEEITSIISNYKKLQGKIITESSLYKNLLLLANQHMPKSNKCLITEKHWELIVKEITSIYPNLYLYIMDRCPELSDHEWQYCCLNMFNFDTNAEANLLNINLSSVRTKRFRLRQKLNITIPAGISFQEFIAEKLMQ